MLFLLQLEKRQFAKTDPKLCVSLRNVSTEDYVKLLKQLESGFKRTIDWNKYQSKLKQLPQNSI